MSITSPFEMLVALDDRCRRNSQGLPVNKSVTDEWVGIGFRIGDRALLAKMDEISEILPPPPTIRVPGVRFWVKGLSNIRGNLLPILDMKAFLDGNITETKKESRILVIDKQGLRAGLIVDEVYGLRRFKPDELKTEESTLTGTIKNYLAGIFDDSIRRWDVFSVEKLVKSDQFIRVV
ncbi:MAG: twitching motility protein PilI [Gammaproteobacteria bacterium]|jgi:twitching motility protein PilI